MTRDTDERGKVARAMQGANAIRMMQRLPWEGLPQIERDHWLFLADAALLALRAHSAGHAEREAILRIVESAKYKSPDAQDQHDWNAACEHIEEGIAALSNAPAPSEGVQDIPADLARAVNALGDYADDLDATERPAIGEYDVTTDIRKVCQALIDALHPADTEDQGLDTPGERP